MTDRTKEILIFKNMDKMAEYAIGKWAEISEKAIRDTGLFTAALSGGKTPLTLYQKLSGQKTLPWDRTHVFIVDERFVPYDSDENNYHIISSTLLRHVEIPAKNIHPILTTEISPEASADKYEEDLNSFRKAIRARELRIDLILLGIGEDGHTASLFPGTPALKESRRMAVAVMPPDKSKKERISFTLPLINRASNIMFLAAGANKGRVVKEIVEEENSRLPAASVKPGNGRLFFLLDESAGALLSGKKLKEE